MRAHQLDASGVIINTIVVESINDLPNLADAEMGGTIGDSIVDGVVIPRPVEAIDPSIEMRAILNETRDLRERILNRLAGIGLAALATGDDITKDGVLVARQSLLDITSVTSVLAATNATELGAALKTEWASIVSAAPVGLYNAFTLVDE